MNVLVIVFEIIKNRKLITRVDFKLQHLLCRIKFNNYIKVNACLFSGLLNISCSYQSSFCSYLKFREYFAKPAKKYEELGQFDYNWDSHLKGFKEAKCTMYSRGCYHVGQFDKEIKVGVGISVLEDGYTLSVNYLFVFMRDITRMMILMGQEELQ